MRAADRAACCQLASLAHQRLGEAVDSGRDIRVQRGAVSNPPPSTP
jgi:hypothetical protein